MKKDGFLKGAAILGIAGMIVKVIGAFFRIPLGWIIESDGLGYYQVGYPIYTFLLAFSAAGFPTAISKLVSEKRAKGNYKGAYQVFKVSFILLLIIGSISSIGLALGARYFVDKIIKSPNAYYAVLAMSPALFFVSLLAAFRGYFQGMQNMIPSAISQVVEQFGRVIIGLGLAIVLMRRSVELAAAGASFGATVGGITGLLVMVWIFSMHRNDQLRRPQIYNRGQEDTFTGVIRDLFRISIPITIGASVLPLISMLDSLIVLRRLQQIGFTYEAANKLFGQLTGMAVTLINLPQVLTVALAASIVPVISESVTKGETDSIKKDTQSAFRISLLIGLPAAIGLAVLSNPIMQLLYPKEPSSIGDILLYLSIAVLFLTQVQTLTGILQGLGKQIVPVRNLMIGAGVKLVTTYVLTGIPALNVKGAALGTVSAYLVASVLNFIAVKKYTNTEFHLYNIFIKPIISALTMGIVVKLGYMLFKPLVGSSISTVLSILIGVAVYGFMLLVTKTITKEDFELLPGGSKLSRILNKAGIMRG